MASSFIPSRHPAERSAGYSLAVLARSASWTWLLEIRQRLDTVVEIVDTAMMPVLPALPTRDGVAVRQLLGSPGPGLAQACTAAMASMGPRSVIAGDYDITVSPIVPPDGPSVGALVTASRTFRGPGASAHEGVGAWLSAAVAAHLASAAATDESDWQQMLALSRLLEQAVAAGSEREVLRAFVEAAAVWEDVEPHAYVRDISGVFVRDLSLAGSNVAITPATLDADRLSAAATSRMPGADLGFGSDADVLVGRLKGASAEWLIVVPVSADRGRDRRFALYFDVVSQSLRSAAGVELSRLSWAVAQQLLAGDDSPAQTLAAAMDELGLASGADAACTLFRPNGQILLRVGQHGPEAWPADHMVNVPVPVKAPYRSFVALTRTGGRPLTGRERALLDVAAAALGAWLGPVARRLDVVGERRTTLRQFDEALEQLGGECLAKGRPVSVVVLFVGDVTADPDAVQRWVDGLRSRLRPTDMTGRLTSGDIAVLLLETPAAGLEVVLERIRRSMAATPPLFVVSDVRIGTVTRSADALSSESLIAAARRNAVPSDGH